VINISISKAPLLYQQSVFSSSREVISHPRCLLLVPLDQYYHYYTSEQISHLNRIIAKNIHFITFLNIIPKNHC
jgi:hypothetical protein